jgi:Skp family chaperone for outer membrane proteins
MASWSRLLFVALLGSVLLLAACERQAPQAPPPIGLVAVIDLDRVARAVGRDETIDARVQGYADQQSTELNRLRDRLRAELQQAQTTLADTESSDAGGQAGLAELTARLDRQLQQEIARARQATDQLRVELVMDFKQEVQPVARRVMQARGLSVLLIQQNAMLYVDPAADITDAVIDELQRIPPSPDGGEKTQ